MTPETVLTIASESLTLTALLAAPLLLVTLITGVLVGVLQAATQINEMTLSFIPKLLAMFAALILGGPWMLEILVDYMEIRIGLYKKRKAWLLNQFESEIKWLSEKARFIGFVINKRIQVLNVPLEEIRTQLRAENFKEELWSKFLDIKTYQYTREEVLKLKDLCERRVAERDVLKNTSVSQMWKNNLSDL